MRRFFAKKILAEFLTYNNMLLFNQMIFSEIFMFMNLKSFFIMNVSGTITFYK